MLSGYWSPPYLTLPTKDAGQREHRSREAFNGQRCIFKTGAPRRWVPNVLPPYEAVYQQAKRWLAAGCFEAMANDLQAVLRLAAGRTSEPSAAILDSHTLHSTPESGERTEYDGAKRKRSSKLHLAVGNWRGWWRCASARRVQIIVPRSVVLLKPFRRPQAAPSASSTWIRIKRAIAPEPPRHAALGWKSSGCLSVHPGTYRLI